MYIRYVYIYIYTKLMYVCMYVYMYVYMLLAVHQGLVKSDKAPTFHATLSWSHAKPRPVHSPAQQPRQLEPSPRLEQCEAVPIKQKR